MSQVYSHAVFGTAFVNHMSEDGARLEKQERFSILVPNILRLTRPRQIEIGRLLWEFAGHDKERWASASEDEKFRWSRMHMGRYNYVEIFTGGDEWWYQNDSGSGGNFPIASLKIVTEGV